MFIIIIIYPFYYSYYILYLYSFLFFLFSLAQTEARRAEILAIGKSSVLARAEGKAGLAPYCHTVLIILDMILSMITIIQR